MINLKDINFKEVAKKEEAEIKADFEFDSVRRTHAAHAGLSGVSLAGIFTCLSIDVPSTFLIVALCCYSICLPAFVASYLFHEMQLGRKGRKLEEYIEIIYDRRTSVLGSIMWVILASGIMFTIFHSSIIAGIIFFFSIIISFIFFMSFYFSQLIMKRPSNTKMKADD